MKIKLLMITMVLALSSKSVMAQVPANVPTNGLVGYWPFNGNVNDESGNNNNATSVGVSLSQDRFGNASSAYSFNGENCVLQKITTPNTIDNLNSYSVSVWYKSDDILKGAQTILNSFPHTYIGVPLSYCSQTTMCSFIGNGGSGWVIMGFSNSWEINNDTSWHNLTLVKTTADIKYYIDGVLKKTTIISSGLNVGSFVMNFGSISINGGISCYETFKGSIDDIAQYNRALTSEEIVGLYNAQAAGCETLVINSGPLSFNPPTYTSTVTIYPNPANDQITIDCGNLANVAGWSIKIVNAIGQEVFTGAMNTPQYVVPLNSWSGQGLYFVKIYDASNNLVNTKKIILQ
ncbi:MAG: T9SS type A sorting domain-containing protein [Flavobacterium sp.]|nr:T9SS type A sorting domain-containing protein [Flavobacterium sp.]